MTDSRANGLTDYRTDGVKNKINDKLRTIAHFSPRKIALNKARHKKHKAVSPASIG